MARWQIVLRCTAYAVLLLIGARWLAAAAAAVAQPAFGTDAIPGHDALLTLGRMAALGAADAFRFAAAIIAVKLVAGAYLVSTVALAVAARIMHGAVSDARLDRALLFSVFAVMLMAAPLLLAGQVMPGTIDDLTLAVIGITFAALSRPEFLGEPSTSQDVVGAG